MHHFRVAPVALSPHVRDLLNHVKLTSLQCWTHLTPGFIAWYHTQSRPHACVKADEALAGAFSSTEPRS